MIASIFFTGRLLHLLRRSIAGRRGRASRVSLKHLRTSPTKQRLAAEIISTVTAVTASIAIPP
jgi:hypothetical protein